MNAPHAIHDHASLRFPQARIAAAVRALDGERRAHVAAAAHSLVHCLQDFAERGQVPLAAVIDSGDRAAPCQWQHYQGRGATPLDGRTQALHYYYHSHAVSGAAQDEHGHFHLFAQLGAGDDGKPRYTHLVAIGVDARGLPLRLFTTNRWVTDETWLPAPRVVALAERIAAATAPAADPVERWLQAQLGVFAPQVAALLEHRDQRVQSRQRSGHRPGLLEDRRMHVLSQCRVSVERQLTAFDHVIH